MPRSQAEARMAFATMSGKKTGMDKKYAKEVVSKIKGHPGAMKALPERAPKTPPPPMKHH